MTFFNKRKQNKSYNIKKSGVKDELVDRQILALHCAMVEKLIQHSTLRPQVFDTLEKRRKAGKLGYGAYLTWYCLLENIEDNNAFRAGVLEGSSKMKKLRRTTPLTGILTEQERQEALTLSSCGNTSIEALL